jgi:exonuclease III
LKLHVHDIICLQETKTDDVDQIDIPGYVFKLKNRKTKSTNKSGGIALGFKEQLSEYPGISI